jgi:uncharacterized protein
MASFILIVLKYLFFLLHKKTMKIALGYVISGSLTEGFDVRIASQTPTHEIKTGKFVSIIGSHYRFFSLITDLRLDVTHPDILLFPPQPNEHLLYSALKSKDMYLIAHVKPMVMLDENNNVCAVKTIPSHFSQVCEVNNHDVALIFGDERADKKYFNIGCPLDMTTPVCLNLERLCERSNGIFGKTGTGKTFVTRLVLAGVIRSRRAVNVIFDMHSEYGLQARKEGAGQSFVKGLKTLFPEHVAIFSLDPTSTRRRGGTADVEVIIPYSAIHVEDITSLQDELNLHPTAVEAAYLIAAKYKKEWLSTLLNQGNALKDFALSVGAHPESVSALYRKLKRIERYPFFVPFGEQESIVERMIEYINRGISIIVEFGNYTSTFAYLLIANIITRRIHAEYVTRTEQFLGSQRIEDQPQQLLITIEEAHKFLNPSAAKQTIFGTIAREMRKYYVSLLVVDQRPSGIDNEVLSQIGTKLIAQLNDEKDIQAALTGVHGATALRTVLSSLDSKKQILILGHAVPMPVVVETRTYDELFYAAMGAIDTQENINSFIKDLF